MDDYDSSCESDCDGDDNGHECDCDGWKLSCFIISNLFLSLADKDHQKY